MKEKRIKGIKIAEMGEEQKIYQYADDTTLILKDIGSVTKAMEIIKKYCEGSGAKVNMEKTVVMRIGNACILPEAFNFKNQQEMKILGILMGENEKRVNEIMWDEIIGRMERRLEWWKQRKLNLMGKILIVNTLMLSKMWYVLGVIPMERWHVQRIKQCVLNFIWEGKPPRIAYNVLIGETEKGGLGLIDPEIRKKSMRVKVVKRFLNKDFKAEWKNVMKYYLNKCGDFNMSDDILWMKLKQNMMTGIPDFYKEVLQAWAEFLNFVEVRPEGRKMLLNQPLFLNANIFMQDKEIFFKHWLNAGIRQVKDVLYEIKEGFLSSQVIVDAVNEIGEEVKREILEKQFEIVKKAIPKEWIKQIEQNYKSKKDVKVFLKETAKDFQECDFKIFYICFRNKVYKRPIAEQFWKRIFVDMDEEGIWKNLKWKFLDTKLECLDYFIRHNVIFTETKLAQIGVSNNAQCKVCTLENENIMHLFLKCTKLNTFMTKMKKVIKQIMINRKEDIEKDEEWSKMFLFGFNGSKTKIVNLFLSVARNVIWERRNIVKNKSVNIDVWKMYKRKLEQYIRAAEEYFKMEGNLIGFNKTFILNNPCITDSPDGIKLKLPK